MADLDDITTHIIMKEIRNRKKKNRHKASQENTISLKQITKNQQQTIHDVLHNYNLINYNVSSSTMDKNQSKIIKINNSKKTLNIPYSMNKNKINATNPNKPIPTISNLKSSEDEEITLLLNSMVKKMKKKKKMIKDRTQMKQLLLNESTKHNKQTIYKLKTSIMTMSPKKSIKLQTKYDEICEKKNSKSFTDKMCNTKIFKCDICENTFDNISELKKHYTAAHITQKNPYFCEICKRSFKFSSSLSIHKCIQIGAKAYKCDICFKTFCGRSNLNIHYRKHTGERPFNCDICNSSFAAKSTLNNHYRKHTGEKPFKCDRCSSSFTTKSSMNNHYRKHTGKKPYECRICGNKYSQYNNLDTHFRVHTGERPFACNICNLLFSAQTTLDKHYRTHTGERPFPCGICSKSFATTSALSVHLKRVHIHNT